MCLEVKTKEWEFNSYYCVTLLLNWNPHFVIQMAARTRLNMFIKKLDFTRILVTLAQHSLSPGIVNYIVEHGRQFVKYKSDTL